MNYIKIKILLFLILFNSIFYFSCSSNLNDTASFDIKNSCYYSTVKLTDMDFGGRSVTYLIDTTHWYGDINEISKIEMDELFLKCTSLSKKLFRNPSELIFLNSIQKSKDDIKWSTCFEKVFETEGEKERNGKELFLIIKGVPKENIPNNSLYYFDGKTWRVEFYIEGDKISEPSFVEMRDDVGA